MDRSRSRSGGISVRRCHARDLVCYLGKVLPHPYWTRTENLPQSKRDSKTTSQAHWHATGSHEGAERCFIQRNVHCDVLDSYKDAGH
jgi:hypothetical protein